ncbi:MAG: hypothetical protein QM692_06085 [Thermomicrobiales bacterium]
MVITSLLALLVVAAAVAAVAWVVLRAPSSAVDSAERLEPVGTALPAATEVAQVPTPTPTPNPAPTTAPEPTAAVLSNEQPAAIALPTVAAPQDAPQELVGPTPTPRVIDRQEAAPTAVPTALPQPTALPTAPPVTAVPVVALQPVQQPPTAVPTQPARTVADTPAVSPTPRSAASSANNDDDPFDIFDTDSSSRIVPVAQDPMERVREMQEDAGNGVPVIEMPAMPGQNTNDRGNRDDRPGANPVIIPALAPTITPGRDGSVEIVVPDVDAMIDEITEQATNPDRQPTSNGGRTVTGKDDDADKNDKKRTTRKRKTPTPRPGQPGVVMPGTQNRPGNSGGNCPFENLPPDQRPDNPMWDC